MQPDRDGRTGDCEAAQVVGRRRRLRRPGRAGVGRLVNGAKFAAALAGRRAPDQDFTCARASASVRTAVEDEETEEGEDWAGAGRSGGGGRGEARAVWAPEVAVASI